MKSTSVAPSCSSLPPFLPVFGFPAFLLPELPDFSLLEPQAATNAVRATRARAANSRSGILIMQGSFPGLCPMGSMVLVIRFVLLGGTWVERVLQAVAHEVEGEDGQEQREAWEGHEPPGDVEHADGVGDH